MTDRQQSAEITDLAPDLAAARLASAMLTDRPGLTGDRLREMYPGNEVMAAVARAVDAQRGKKK